MKNSGTQKRLFSAFWQAFFELLGLCWKLKQIIFSEKKIYWDVEKCENPGICENPGDENIIKMLGGKAPNLEFFIKMKPTRKPMKLNPILSPHLEILDNSSLWQRFCSL